MFCDKCGKPLNEGASFCSHCGAKVSANNAPPEFQFKEKETESKSAVIAKKIFGLVGKLIGIIIFIIVMIILKVAVNEIVKDDYLFHGAVSGLIAGIVCCGALETLKINDLLVALSFFVCMGAGIVGGIPFSIGAAVIIVLLALALKR